MLWYSEPGILLGSWDQALAASLGTLIGERKSQSGKTHSPARGGHSRETGPIQKEMQPAIAGLARPPHQDGPAIEPTPNLQLTSHSFYAFGTDKTSRLEI